MQASGKKLVIQAPPTGSISLLYEGRLFGDVDMTVKVVLAKGDVSEKVDVIFWGTDKNNYYSASIGADGLVGVGRKTDGKWLYPVIGRNYDAVHRGLGAVNELRVVTYGKSATVYINEQRCFNFDGFPPEGPSKIGFHAESPGQASSIWQFSELVVRKPQ